MGKNYTIESIQILFFKNGNDLRIS